MNPVVVGISGMNAVDNPGPGVGVARSLRADPELDVQIVGLAYNALEPGIYMDWVVDRSFTLPYPSGQPEEYLARLAYVKERTGLNCIIPCLDAELPLFIKYEAEIRRMGIRTCIPTMSQFRLRAKDRLAELADKSGLHAPRTMTANSEAEVARAVEEIGLPLFVKGIYYDARKAHTLADALVQFRRLMAEWGGPVLLQEVVKGDELNLVGAGDGKGGLLGMVGAKKTYVTALGKMWGGTTIHHPALSEAAERFVAAHRWRGPFELECMVDGDTVHLIEINPRFPAWVYFATAVGVNIPSRLVRSMIELPCETASEYDAGKLFVRFSYEMVAPRSDLQHILSTGELPCRPLMNAR